MATYLDARHGLATAIAVAILVLGTSCSVQTREMASFDASDIDQDRLTIDQYVVTDLLDDEVILRGEIARKGGTPSLVAGGDSRAAIDGRQKQCISLLMNGGAASLPDESIGETFEFLGRFVLLDNMNDLNVVYYTYKGIEFTLDCQSTDPNSQSMYFLVRAVRQVGTSKFMRVPPIDM